MAKRELQSFEWAEGTGKGSGEFTAWWSKNTLVLLGNFGGMSMPIVYVRRPKGLVDEDWAKVKAQFRKHMTTFDQMSFETR